MVNEENIPQRPPDAVIPVGWHAPDDDSGEWEVWPEAMNTPPAAAAAAPVNDNEQRQHWPEATGSRNNQAANARAAAPMADDNDAWQHWPEATNPQGANPAAAPAPNAHNEDQGWEDWPEATNPAERHPGWEHFPEALDPNATTPPLNPASTNTIDQLVRGRVTKGLATQPNNECHICIERYEVGQSTMWLPCGHYFHDECVVPWLRSWGRCPICSLRLEERGSA